MLYNKSQLSKTSDKKLMRKVKSKWVVVSTAAFAAGGFALASQGADAHADTVNNASQSQTTQQSTTNSTTQNTQQNTAPTLASNDLTQGQVTGTANAGNTVATGANNDSSDQVLNGQSSANATSQSAAIKYDGFTNTRAQDVDPTHYNANDSNSTSQAYQQGSNDYNDYRYGIVGDLQTPGNNGSGNSWGTQRNTSWNAAYKYQQDKQNNSVQSDASIQSQTSISVSGGNGSMPVSGYTSKIYTAAYIDAKHIDENETAKGEYRARNELSRPDDSTVTNLATSWNTNNSQGYNYDQNDANRTYNAFNQALTSTDSSKDYIGISSQVYDIYKLAAQKAEAGITDENALDAAYQTLVYGYNKYKGSGMQAGMPVTIQTQPQTRSQNPVWADGTQYGLGVKAGLADVEANKAMTLGTDVNYNAGYTNAFNGYNKGISDAMNYLSYSTPFTSNIPYTPTDSKSKYPEGYTDGFSEVMASSMKEYRAAISDAMNKTNSSLFNTGFQTSDYQGHSQTYQQTLDAITSYWNQNAPASMQIPVNSTRTATSAQILDFMKKADILGFGAMNLTNPIDKAIANNNAISNNAAGLYTATDGKSLTLTASPSSSIDANTLKTFDAFMQAKASGHAYDAAYNNGLINQSIAALADNLTQYAFNDTLLSNVSQGDSGIQQALKGNIGTGSPSDALNAAYEYNVAKGYQDASQGVAYSQNNATNGSYAIGYNAYKDIKIAVDNSFGANEQAYNGDSDTYATISQSVSTIISAMFPSAGAGNLSFEKYLPSNNTGFSGGDLAKFIPAYVASLKGLSSETQTGSIYNDAFTAAVSPHVDAASAANNITNLVLNALSQGSGSGAGDAVGIMLNGGGNNLVQYGTNIAPYNGYSQDLANAALTALVAGVAGNSFTPDTANLNTSDATTNTVYSALKKAYVLGQQISQGVNDAINGKRYSSSDNVSDAKYNANLGALQALTEINNSIQNSHYSPFTNNGNGFLYTFVFNGGPGAGNALGSSSSTISPALRKTDALPATSYGYQLIYAAISNNLSSGAYQFSFNVARPTLVGTNYAYDLSKQAFDNAKKGLNVYGTTNEVNQWDGLYPLQSIVNQTWADAQSGIAYVQANAKVPTDGSAAYQAAAQAYYDVNLNLQPSSKGSLYMDIYNDYTNQHEGTEYARGVRGAVQPNMASDGSGLIGFLFSKGQSDGKDAYAAAMKADATMPSNFTPIQQAGFQGVRDAIHNQFAGSNDRVSTSKFQGVGNGDQNDVYQAFYNYAQANLKSTKDLIAQFQGSDDTDSDATDLHAYFNVYQNYMKGFTAGEANSDNPNANDTFINAGYNDGVKVYKAVQDFLQSPVGNDSLTEAASDAMNDVENQSSAPRNYITRLQREAYRLTYNELNAVAQKVVSDFQNPTGAVSYVGSDAKSQVSQRVHNSLQNIFSFAVNGYINLTGSYGKEGRYAYEKLLMDAQAVITNPSLSSSEVGNQLVWQAVEDGLGHSSHGHLDNQGIAYDTFYNMAKKIKDNQDSLAKAQADAAKADADRDAANKRADQSDANANQAQADKTAAQQAQSQAEADKSQADAQRDAAVKAQQQAEADKANAQKAQADAEAKAQQAEADKAQADTDRDNAIKAQQQAEADKAQADTDRDNAIKAQQQADADRDAANKRADQSDANAKQADADKAQAEQDKANALAQAAQAEADKAKAEQAQAQAQAAQSDAEAKRDAAIKAQQQAEADRDAAIKAQQAAQAQSQTDGSDKAQAEADKANAIEAQQRAENARDAAIKAQQDAEAQRDDAVKAQQQAEADKNAALQAQKTAEDKAAQATDAMNKADAERDAANAANQQAQADKATAQKAQADAEATAKQAEQDKANAQAAMQQAIADRDKAVSDRDNAIKQMNDAIADANQKVADAQKAESDAEAQVKVAQAAQADAQRRADEATAEAATAKKISDDAVIGKQDADARAQKATDDMNKAIAERDEAKAETQKATDAMNDAIKAKNDAIAQAQQANADKQAAINKANADIADANQRIANAIQAQNDAQAKAQQAQKDADAARAKASQDVADAKAQAQSDVDKAKSEAQAEIDKAKAQAQSDIDKAKSEAQAEVAKAQSDNSKSDAVRKADEARELREAEHQQKVNYKHGYELAFADARNGRMKPATFLDRENQFFVRGYEQGFMAYMNKHMPRYVTNTADIHIYDGDTFTTKNRGKLVDTKHAKNFRVYGVTFNQFGHIRYSIGNGKFITANRKFVVPTYFAPTNKAKNIKVRLGRTILVHKNKGFSDRKHLRVLHSGDVIHVRRVIKFHGITRLVVKGGYITSNRLFVKLAK